MSSLVLTGDTSGQVTLAAPAVAGTTTLTLPATTGTILNDATVGVCRAWVNYKGTSTQSVRASFNVSSVTYVSLGNYTVNFTNALTDANYSAVATCNFESDIGMPANTKTFATSSIQVSSFRPYPYNVYLDVTTMSVAVFR